MKKHSLKIVKIPSPKSPTYRQEFVSQPINYLKIIENKDKIKVNHLAKEYDPRTDLKELAGKRLVYPNPEPFIPPAPSSHNDNREHYIQPQSLSPPKPIGSNTVNNIHNYDFDIPLDSDDEDYKPKFQPQTPPKQSFTPPPQKTYTPPSFTPPRAYTPPAPPHFTPLQEPSSNHTPTPEYYNYNLSTPVHTPPTNINEQHLRLHNFLQHSDSDDEDYPRDVTYKKRNVVDPYKYMSEDQREFVKLNHEPPTLTDLEKTGEYKNNSQYLDSRQLDALLTEKQNVDYPHPESYLEQQPTSMIEEDDESIDDKKRDILFNLDMLRKKYPQHAQTIPMLNMQTPYTEVKHVYELELRKLRIDNDVGNYRQYLMGGFMLIEYILGRFLRLDLEGFTQQQIVNMQQYEIFLIEIGEKNYVPNSKKWPVEVRLLFFIIIQAGLFTVSKLILHKTGSNLLSMFNTVINPPQNNKNKRMKRPDIDIENDL